MSPLLQGDGQQANIEEINSCLTQALNGTWIGFFRLQSLLKLTKIYEYHNRTKLDPALRDAFFDVAQKMQEALQKIKDSAIDQLRCLDDSQKNQLKIFRDTGFGLNSTDIYTFPILPFDSLDSNYGSKIMSFLKLNYELRANDILLGDPNRRIYIGPDKHRIPMNIRAHDLWIPSRLELQNKVKEEAMSLSESSSKLLHSQFDATIPKGGRIFFRGPQGCGKTFYLKSAFHLDESAFPTTDSLKRPLGGNLSHNESAYINDQLPRSTISLVMKTNIKQRDVGTITKLNNNEVHEVIDITASQETIQALIEKRNKERGRGISEEIIIADLNESRATRPAILEAAKQNSKLRWQLIENTGTGFIEVASIREGLLKITNLEAFNRVCQNDSLLKETLERLYPDLQ